MKSTTIKSKEERPSTRQTEHKQFTLEKPKPRLNIEERDGTTYLRSGRFMSPNYAKGVRGFMISTDGYAEFQDGYFRGKLAVGGFQVTVNTTDELYDAITEVDNEGGGIVYMADGTYVLTRDLEVPGGIILAGVNRDGTIIDCNGSYAVTAIGADPYVTGSVTLSTGDASVIGSGITAWDSTMIGKAIFLGKNGQFDYYEISGVTNTSTLTIATQYSGVALTNEDYVIVDPVTNPTFRRFTITNATGSGMKIQYCLEPHLDDLVIYGCGTGIEMRQTVFPRFFLTSIGNGVNLYCNQMSGFEITFSELSDATTGDGVEFIEVGDGTIFDSSSNGNAGAGIKMTDCTGIAVVSFSAFINGTHGVHMVSNNTDNTFTNMVVRDNTTDGFRLDGTTNGSIISVNTIKNNGAYGINIVAGSCNSTLVTSNRFSGNATDAMLNSGTDTKIKSNIGLTDTP